MTPPHYAIQLLGGEHSSRRRRFNCGVAPLDDYLRAQAGQDARRHLATVFVAIDEATGAIAGYYTLSNQSIRLGDFPDAITRKLPRYPLIPVTLLGRLAVDLGYRGKGLGETLLIDALVRAVKLSVQGSGSYAVVVDAKDDQARNFYMRYHFQPFPQTPDKLFLEMATVIKTFASAIQ